MGKIFNTRIESYHELARFIRRRLAVGILVNFFTGLSALLAGVFVHANHLPYPFEAFVLIAVISMIGANAGGLLAIRLTSGSLKTIERVETSLEEMARAGKVQSSRNYLSQPVDSNSISESLNRLLDRLEETRSEQLELFAGIAHDLRSPLAAIIGYAELLADPELSKDRAYLDKCRDVILAQGHQILELVDDTMSNIALQTGQDQLNKVSFHLAAFLEDLLKEVKKTSGCDTRLENSAGDVIVLGDLLRLREAFLKIVEEALESNSDAHAIQIGLKPARDPGYVDIPVIESGELADLNLWSVESNFYSTHERNRAEKGIDRLRLDLITSIISKHDGKVSVWSPEGSGPIFTVSLPIVQAA